MSKKILAYGEAMVEFNQSIEDPRYYLEGFGGDTSNFCIAAARQGADTGYISAVGDDHFGKSLQTLWKSENVDTSYVDVMPTIASGVYVVTHDDAGHHFNYLRTGSAPSRYTPAHLPLQAIADAELLHLSGISLAISESACDAGLAAMAHARKHGTLTSLDTNLRLRLWPLEQARATIQKTIALVDVFLPSLDEAQTLSGQHDIPSVIAWCAQQGAKKVVLKCGADGAWVWEQGQDEQGKARHVAAFKVEPMDATGAGDCFDGALVARLAAGDNLTDATRYANVAAAISTTGYGAVAPIPDQGQVLIHIVETLL